MAVSGGEATQVARKERGAADVVQAKVQHHYTLHTHAKPAMRGRTIFKAVYVRLDALQRDTQRGCTFCASSWDTTLHLQSV